MKRFVVVGTGVRCYGVFLTHVLDEFKDTAKIVGVYDVNKVRMQVYKDKLGDDCTIYNDFDKMLDSEKPDAVIVTTVDCFHHEYIVRSLDKGYDVISEKPVTNTYERCKEIRDAEKRSGHKVTVTFNCRYMPYFAKVKSLLMENVIGKIMSVNYEYTLNRWHGGDYFKRWHGKMEKSEGMLLHKSTHHFDIVNWFLEDEPVKVTALGNTVYYNNKEKYLGERCSTCKYASECESYKSQTEKLDQILYFNAEKEDGYIRDKCCFAPDSDIYDNMSVAVTYSKGTMLTYSLNLFSHTEGYRMTLRGEKGDMIIGNHESDSDKELITIIYKNGEVRKIYFEKAAGTHAGGDIRMLANIFGTEKDAGLKQQASGFDGFSSAMIGIGANMSIKQGKTIELTPLLDTLR